MALGAHGNVEGRVPSPYLEVPVPQYSAPSLAANPYPPNVFTADQLKALYGSKVAYRARVDQALGGPTRAGWFLPSIATSSWATSRHSIS
jgi:hypothetical protein